jgi:cytochrome c biogenesis protein CcdA
MERKLLLINIFQYLSIGISFSGLVLLFTSLVNTGHDDILHIIVGLFILVVGSFNSWLAFKLKKAHVNRITYSDGLNTPKS